MTKCKSVLAILSCAPFIVAPVFAKEPAAPRAATTPSATSTPVDAARAAELLREYEKSAGKPIVLQEKDESAPIKIGENNSTGRPAPMLEPQVESLKARVAELENKLDTAMAQINATNAELSKMKTQLAGDLSTLKSQFASHSHHYTAGANYTNVAIHGHPAWDVPTKYCSQITGGMGYSTEWSTSKPLY